MSGPAGTGAVAVVAVTAMSPAPPFLVDASAGPEPPAQKRSPVSSS